MEPKELATQAMELSDRARAFPIRNDTDFGLAADYLADLKAMEKEIKSAFDPIVEAAHKAHKTATDQRKKALEPVTQALDYLKGLMGSYHMEQERAAKALEAEANKAREAEEKRLLAEAEKKALAGDKEGAKAIIVKIDEAQQELRANLTPTPKVGGVCFRDNWQFEITDAAALPRQYLTPDLKKIGEMVKVLKDMTDIPGVRVWVEKTVVARTA